MFSLYRSNKCLSSILLHKTEHIFATNVCFLKNAVLLCSYDYSRFGGNNTSEGNITTKQKDILEYIKVAYLIIWVLTLISAVITMKLFNYLM